MTKTKHRTWRSPIELQLRNALVEQAMHVESHGLMLLDYSTSTKQAVADVKDGRVTGVCDLEEWGIDEKYRGPFGHGDAYWTLYSSVLINSYKVDFLLVIDYGEICVAIECDGHEWHDRTKQQASSDRARDRELLRLNVPTLRFTGSDIHHDADRCAVEVIEICKLIGDRSFMAGHMNGWSDGYRKAVESCDGAKITKADL